MDDFLLEIRATFIEELNDSLNEFQHYINNIEGEFLPVHIDNAFRVMHTIKGNCQACGYTELSKVIHEYEDYLSSLKDKGVGNKVEFIDKNMNLISELFIISDILKNNNSDNVDLSGLDSIVKNIVDKPLKIVIIDDEEELVELQETLLLFKYKNAQVSKFTDSSKALESLKNEKFDLIITDFNMPVVDGNQIIESMRNESTKLNFKTPVIMVTSYKPPMFSDGDLHTNVFYVKKPFSQKSFYYYVHCAQIIADM